MVDHGGMEFGCLPQESVSVLFGDIGGDGLPVICIVTC